MNILDLIILGLMTFFLIKGIFRGFFREISSLAGIISGFLIGNHYYHPVANLLRAHIPFERFLPLISFVILFILVVIIICYLLIVLLTFFMPSKNPLIVKSKAARLVIVTYQSMARLISPDLYKTWKKRISQESGKVGKMISEGKEAVKSIPEILPDKKE